MEKDPFESVLTKIQHKKVYMDQLMDVHQILATSTAQEIVLSNIEEVVTHHYGLAGAEGWKRNYLNVLAKRTC